MKSILVYGIVYLLMPLMLFSDTLRASKPPSLSERVKQLVDISSKKVVVPLNGPKFKEFIKTSPRNYSFIVMLTAMQPQRQCSVCSYVNDEFMVAARSFRVAHGLTDKVFFGVVDFDSASEIFQMLKINTAPVIMHFPPGRKLKSADTMDMQRSGFSAEAMARWMADKTDMDFKIFRSPSYFAALSLFFLFVFASVLVYFKQDNLEYLRNKTLWAVTAILFCLLMTSGQMWNHIRNPPLFHHSQNGQNVYIHGSSQGQFISETYIILLLNIGFVACVITIIESTNSNKEMTGNTRVLAISCLAGAVLIFSLILAIFRVKAGGYPYRGLL